MADYSKYLPTLAGAPPPAPRVETGPGANWGYGAASFINSWPELFGGNGWIKPDEVNAWRQAHPGMNLTSQLLGLLVPYGGWAKAAGMGLKGVAAAESAVPLLSSAGKVFQGWEAAKATAPIANAIKQDLALTIPFEAARLSAVAVNKPEALGEEAGNSLLGLGLLPAFHGGLGLLRAAAPWKSTTSKIAGALPNFPVKAPLQDQLKFLYENMPKADQTTQPWLRAQANMLERQVLGQQPRGAKYVTSLVGGGDAGDVNRLFQMKAENGLSRRQFIVSPKTGFASRAEADALLKAVGLPEGWGAEVQFPRHITAAEQGNAKAIQKTVSKNLQPIQNGWYVGQEDKSGLYVLARKLSGDPAKAAAGDTWTVLKTSQPNRILGSDAISMAAERQITFANGLKQARELQDLMAMPEDSIARLVDAAKRTFAPGSLAARGADAALEKLPGAARNALQTLKSGTEQERAALGSMYEFARDKMVPAQAEFRDKPLAEHVRLVSQTAADVARAKTQKLMFGPQGLKEDQSIYGRLVQTDKARGIAGLIDKLEAEDMPIVTALRNAEVPAEKRAAMMAELGVGPMQMERIEKLFQELGKVDERLTQDTVQAEKLYGLDAFEARPNHNLISHTWKGSWRQRVLDEKGNTVSMGAGRTRMEAVRAAEKHAEALGARVDERGPFQSDADLDASFANTIFKRERSIIEKKARGMGVEPYTFRLRQGVGGFIGEKDALTKAELHDIVHDNIRRRYNYLAEQAIKNQVMPETMEVYSRYGLKTFKALAYRINHMFGIKGGFDKAQNEAMDKVLSPILGKNSADKLVRAANQGEMFLNLLAFNLAHPIMNALTFVQTVVPKAAFVLGAGPEGMQRVMGYMPAFSPEGRVSGFMGVFEPLKLATQSFRDMAKPDQELRSIFNRAAEEGVITSGLQEQYVGERSAAGKWISNNLSETNPMRRMLENMDSSPFLNPSKKSEELSRAHALVVGRNLARALGATDPDQIYQFAKQFTHRSMYQYTTADRPKLFNGPMGSLFGLFKNWTFHYIADMALYGGAAAKKEQFAPLLWALGGQAALAGAGGTLGYGIADAASKMLTNQGLMDNLYGMFDPEDKRVADTIFYGLPALLGVSLQANAASPFANPAKDVAYLTNFAIVDRAKKIASAMSYFGGQLGAGQNPLTNEQTWDKMAYALAPRTLYKALGMVEDGALKAASNGQPIISGISGPEWAANTFGLTPIQIAKAWELNDRLFTEKDRLSTLVGSLGEAFYQAQLRGDSGTMEEVIRTAILQGAPIPNVMASARAKMRAGAEPSLASGLAGNPTLQAAAANLGFGSGL